MGGMFAGWLRGALLSSSLAGQSRTGALLPLTDGRSSLEQRKWLYIVRTCEWLLCCCLLAAGACGSAVGEKADGLEVNEFSDLSGVNPDTGVPEPWQCSECPPTQFTSTECFPNVLEGTSGNCLVCVSNSPTSWAMCETCVLDQHFMDNPLDEFSVGIGETALGTTYLLVQSNEWNKYHTRQVGHSLKVFMLGHDGTVDWEHVFTQSSRPTGYASAVTSSDTMLILFSTEGDGSVHGDEVTWLLELDSAGEVLREFQVEIEANINGMVLMADNGLVVATRLPVASPDGGGMWVRRLDSSLAEQWSQFFPDPSEKAYHWGRLTFAEEPEVLALTMSELGQGGSNRVVTFLLESAGTMVGEAEMVGPLPYIYSTSLAASKGGFVLSGRSCPVELGSCKDCVVLVDYLSYQGDVLAHDEYHSLKGACVSDALPLDDGRLFFHGIVPTGIWAGIVDEEKRFEFMEIVPHAKYRTDTRSKVAVLHHGGNGSILLAGQSLPSNPDYSQLHDVSWVLLDSACAF